MKQGHLPNWKAISEEFDIYASIRDRELRNVLVWKSRIPRELSPSLLDKISAGPLTDTWTAWGEP